MKNKAWVLSKRTDIVGNKYSSLLVIEYSFNRKGTAYFKCICDCTNVFYASKRSLKIGKTTSCGCKRSVGQRKFTQATANEEYSKHRHSGIKRSLGYLSREDWDKIVFNPCYYCGLLDIRNNLNRHKVRKERAKGLVSLWDLSINGVDRVNSSLPYTKDNCVSCCGVCNMMKGSISLDQFELRIKTIYENRALNTKRTTGELDQRSSARRRLRISS